MIGWIGTVASIFGSFAVAFQVLVFGYILFLVGSVAWLTVAVTKGDKPLGILNVFFLCANIIGLWRSV